MVAFVDTTLHHVSHSYVADQKSVHDVLPTHSSKVEELLKEVAHNQTKIEQLTNKISLLEKSFTYNVPAATIINPNELTVGMAGGINYPPLALTPMLQDLRPSMCSPVAAVFSATFVCSLASRIMTKVLTWRNVEQSDTLAGKTILGCKIIASEIAQPVIATVALVESIVYGFFSLGSRLFSKEESRDSYNALLKSSSFTIKWSAAVFAYYNFSFSSIPTQEWQMREFFMSKGS